MNYKVISVDAAQEDHKIEQKDSRDAETTARRIIDRMVRHRIVTVRTAQVSREAQEETVRMEADVSVTAIMTPEIRVRDAEMTVRDHPAEEIREAVWAAVPQ